MGIPKIPEDAKLLIGDHEKILASLQEGQQRLEACEAEVSAAAEALKKQMVLHLLQEIPVEELNREKRGIRVKTLREHGYETMADLHFASWEALEAVNGISQVGATAIQEFTKKLAEQAEQGARIRLSVDSKSAESTRLVVALSQWQRLHQTAQTCIQLLDSHGQSIRRAIGDMRCSRNAFLWLFASKQSKQRAHAAYARLAELMNQGYGPRAKETIRALSGISLPTQADAWSDFEKNSISFYNVLENLCHGVLAAQDGAYGLPESLTEGVREEPVYTDGLLCQLRHYQYWGVQYILHQKKVLLGDEMGLGKTIQAIAAMVSLHNTGATHFLVVCPASVLENWSREISRHSVLTVHKIHGTRRQAALEKWQQTGGAAVTTYETTGALLFAEEFRIALLIVDEAHYIKNPSAQRSQNVQRLCGRADRLLFMTGTALENRVDEMLSLISILQPEVADKAKEMAALSAAPQFQREIAPVYCRRKREDVLIELPDLIEVPQWCALYKQEKEFYDVAVLTQNFNLARRVSWNVGIPSAKAERMLELIGQAREEGRKVLVFSFFLDTLAIVKEVLGDCCMPLIDGSVPPQGRQEIVDAFDRAPGGTVLAAQIQAGGTGLNIQSASVVILCEPQLKPSIENQAISRAYRMGQTRNVLVYRLLCAHTVDEQITALLQEKQAAFDAFADDSAAADSLELDSKSFHQLMQAELSRVAQETQTSAPTGEDTAM